MTCFRHEMFIDLHDFLACLRFSRTIQDLLCAMKVSAAINKDTTVGILINP